MTRLASIVISLMGSLGIALSVGYLILVFRAFQPGGAEVTEFLIGRSDGKLGWGFLVVLVPYTLLLAHMWFRIRLGDWMLERGDLDGAAEYAARRMRPNPLRAAKEALAHRVTLMRVHVRRGEYEEALRLAQEAPRLGRPNPWQTRFRRWLLEIALRRENLVAANEIIAAAGVVREHSADAAAFHAAAAEVATREGNAAVARERIESAKWAGRESSSRVLVAEALRAAKFELEHSALEDALQGLEKGRTWLTEIPGAEGELLACEARLLVKLGRPQEARATLEGADAVGDARSAWALEDVRKEIDDGDEGRAGD